MQMKGGSKISETHSVKLGGDDVVKVRLQGTKEDMEWLEEQLKQLPNV